MFYLLMLLAFGAFGFVLSSGSNVRADNLHSFAPLIIVILAMIIPTISVTVRRLHDRDMSGWWCPGFIAQVSFHGWQIDQSGNIGSLCPERHGGTQSFWP
ncbi:DUF805 domain-containing protein [Cypionkella sp. TWP1-2-1b2]|uniref:DUF805 domain-containing protein n=1 Tax=Cypionkella sp. TWP1-2-1b2 TaxID=2804675 RepID=UPI003CEA1D56